MTTIFMNRIQYPRLSTGTDVPYVGEDAARTAPHETRASTNHDGLNDGL